MTIRRTLEPQSSSSQSIGNTMTISNNFGLGLPSSINRASAGITTSSERIASGQRINSAQDDAAGSAIANRLSSQISGFSQSIRNANDGISLLQTADASLSSLTDGIQRIRELALQASNGTLSDQDRKIINTEAQQIKDEINRTIESSQFNNKPLLNNDDSIALQVGDNQDSTIELDVSDFSQVLSDLDFSSIDLSTSKGASASLDILDQAQDQINQNSADIGASLNRLDSTINSLSESEIAAQSARSRIEDADIAKEVSDLTANQIKRDASIALQAQANEQQKSILQLLQDL